MLFQNILIPFDGSKCSYRASKIAFDMAKRYNSKVMLLTILRTPISGSRYIDSHITKKEFRAQRKKVQKEFDKFEHDAKKSGVSVSSKIIVTENIGKAIVSFAKTKKVILW